MFPFFPQHLFAGQTLAAEWLKLSATSGQIAYVSAVTITHRIPHFVEAALGFPDAQAEVRRAGMEKIAATLEAQMAAGVALMQASMTLAHPITALGRVQALADLTNATLAPVQRRATANARRLTQARRKRLS